MTHPVRSSGDGSTESSDVHGEDLGLVDPGDWEVDQHISEGRLAPRTWTERPGERPREAEDSGDTGNTHAGVLIAWLGEGSVCSSLPGHPVRIDQ